jgi:hypothetical protein
MGPALARTRVGDGAGLPMRAVLGAGSQAAGVESVDDVVAVAGGCAGEVEAAVEWTASGGVIGGTATGRAIG